MEYFSKIIIPNGYNGKGDNACYTAVDCLFTRNFWTTMTWTGINRGNKAKKGFREYGNATQLLCNIVQIGDPLYTAKQLEQFCRNRLFRYSKARLISQQLRKSSCRPNRARKAIVNTELHEVDDGIDDNMDYADESQMVEEHFTSDPTKETESSDDDNLSSRDDGREFTSDDSI